MVVKTTRMAGFPWNQKNAAKPKMVWQHFTRRQLYWIFWRSRSQQKNWNPQRSGSVAHGPLGHILSHINCRVGITKAAAKAFFQGYGTGFVRFGEGH
jgi:hypothetical protein